MAQLWDMGEAFDVEDEAEEFDEVMTVEAEYLLTSVKKFVFGNVRSYISHLSAHVIYHAAAAAAGPAPPHRQPSATTPAIDLAQQDRERAGPRVISSFRVIRTGAGFLH